MKRKKIIFFFLGVFFFMIFIFLSAHLWKEKQTKGMVEDFKIEKLKNEILISNKREGMELKIPLNFKIEKERGEFQWGLFITSPFAKKKIFPFRAHLKKQPPIYEEGFALGIYIEKSAERVERVRNYFKGYLKFHFPPKGELNDSQPKIHILEIGQRLYLKEIWSFNEKAGLIFLLRTPLNSYKNLLIFFSCPYQERENSLKELEKVLKSLKI